MKASVMEYPFPLNLYRDLCNTLKREPLPDAITDDEKKGIELVISSIGNPRYKTILFERYKDGKKYSELAEEYDFSYQRASQIIKKILSNLCKTSFVGMIFGYEEYIATTTVEDLDFSTRALRALLRNDINTLDDMKYHGKEGIKKLRNIGDDTYAEIIEKTWFLWDESLEDKLSEKHVRNITKALKDKGWKTKQIADFIDYVNKNDD
ncbi:DNA-directed RNA polymerase subunit alpha C-terminal domain-containing protein [Butyrivibrio sp. FC2001]|uniref:DNA-directed RNA polymerase subunit alpha C-terminal domain-containing protein n=1 Tax=Butyrivibrio sp. FC2001 TaxID=1280671 RepID=UPI0003FEDC9B|nr:DNA-directed RNA polymerase subunit alpha C-terminal domain-containing protein [Butyrivibrio sp. FC2001]